MHWKSIAAVVLRHFYLLRGSPARMLPLFVWVAIDMVLWGFITKYLNTISLGGFDLVPVLLGAVLLYDFFIRVMQGVTITFFEDVWSRNFLNIFATPLTISEYISGLVLSSIVTSSIGLIIMFLLATLVFGLSFATYGFMLAPYLLVLFVFGIALGVFGSALVLRMGPASEWLIWPIPGLISPFVGVFYPISTLPGWMHYISYLLPPTYVFEYLRATISGGETHGSSLLCAGGLAILYLLLSCVSFTRIYRYAVRTGLIARYSAETVT